VCIYTTEWFGCIFTVSRITYLPRWFPVVFPAVFVFLSVLLLYGRSSLTSDTFLWRSDLTVFNQQPASDADSTCPAYKTLPGYSFSRSTLVGLWFNTAAPFPLARHDCISLPACCNIHPKAAVAHPHDVDAPGITNCSTRGQWGFCQANANGEYLYHWGENVVPLQLCLDWARPLLKPCDVISNYFEFLTLTWDAVMPLWAKRRRDFHNGSYRVRCLFIQ